MDKYLEYIYKLSIKSFKHKEIPVGCIILNKNNKIISTGINDRQNKCKITGHAEINAIINAERKINDWRLDGYYMIVNLKPCKMCQQIIKESRIDKVLYVINNDNNGDFINNMEKINNIDYENKFSTLLSDFFRSKR